MMPSYLAGGHPGEPKGQLTFTETVPSAGIHALSMILRRKNALKYRHRLHICTWQVQNNMDAVALVTDAYCLTLRWRAAAVTVALPRSSVALATGYRGSFHGKGHGFRLYVALPRQVPRL